MSVISEVCAHIHNYFEDDPVTGERMIYQGHYKIENGSITLPFMKPGQYIRIFGSELNDGVYKYPVEPAEGEEPVLQDEEFDGVIWKMRPPKEFLDLVDEINDWQEKYGAAVNSPYQSEDVIGVYRYTKASAGLATWQKVFEQLLKPYRRLP